MGASSLPAAILAHHPGWESMALVVGPILLIGFALAVVKRRVDRLAVGAFEGYETDALDESFERPADPSAPAEPSVGSRPDDVSRR